MENIELTNWVRSLIWFLRWIMKLLTLCTYRMFEESWNFFFIRLIDNHFSWFSISVRLCERSFFLFPSRLYLSLFPSRFIRTIFLFMRVHILPQDLTYLFIYHYLLRKSKNTAHQKKWFSLPIHYFILYHRLTLQHCTSCSCTIILVLWWMFLCAHEPTTRMMRAQCSMEMRFDAV